MAENLVEKEKAIAESLAVLKELCRNRGEAIAFWQVLHTPELDAYLERRRQWEANSLEKGGHRVVM